MEIKFICPYWGQAGTGAAAFVAKAKAAGYDGVEVNVPEEEGFGPALMDAANAQGILFIAQQWLPPAAETVPQYLRRFKDNLYRLAQWKPLFINSHTGKDFFSFEDNCRIIEAGISVATETGVPVLHETHRGRFAFHAFSLLPYLQAFPQLKLTADFSHWCTVSESLLEDQAEIIQRIIPQVQYLHARVGTEQGPQAADPQAPEQQAHLRRFLQWWDAIVEQHKNTGSSFLAVCPEAGPPPYMPVMPYTAKPLADQWEINCRIMNLLKQRYAFTDDIRRPINQQDA